MRSGWNGICFKEMFHGYSPLRKSDAPACICNCVRTARWLGRCGNVVLQPTEALHRGASGSVCRKVLRPTMVASMHARATSSMVPLFRGAAAMALSYQPRFAATVVGAARPAAGGRMSAANAWSNDAAAIDLPHVSAGQPAAGGAPDTALRRRERRFESCRGRPSLSCTNTRLTSDNARASGWPNVRGKV